MAYAPPHPLPSRPVGVAILAILVILAGIILTLLSLLAVIAFLALTGLSILTILFGIAFLLSLLLLLAGVGLWGLRPWAWWLSMIVLVLTIATELSGASVSGGLRQFTTGELIAIGVPVLILIYLFAVRKHFTRRPAYR